MRHLSDAATAWELEAERRREVLQVDAAVAHTARRRHVAATTRPAILELLLRQAGRLNQKRVTPSVDSAPTLPPEASTSCLTIASPMPAPPRARSRDFSTR